MGQQVLYRKYRSKSLDEIVGQEHITTTLKNALKSGKISHAYLFTGPRGVGKTSIARILAHELNELEYTGEDMHLDIIEIDAASNRGIDEIRDLREKVTVAPAHGKYKVYIIDEVHMLTTPAFNALLKTLEEPPAHVVFILATTESHKLPQTIISRTQRYNFRPVEEAKVIAHLQYIAKEEGITIDRPALTLIAQHGEGSFRDSISLLNQAANHSSTITADTIQQILGLPPQEAIESLLRSVAAGNKPTVITQLGQLYEQGYQAGTLAKQLGQIGREMALGERDTTIEETRLYSLLTQLINVPASPAPERLLEIVLLEACPSTHVTPLVITPSPPHETATKPKKAQAASVAQSSAAKERAVIAADSPPEQSKAVEPAISEQAPPRSAQVVDFELDAIWPELLKAIKVKHNTVYGILRMADPILDGEVLRLTFKYAFHQKRMQEAKHRKIICDVIEHLTGQPITIECQYDKNVQEHKPLGTEEPAEVVTSLMPTSVEPPIATISNIFGGGELLES